MSDLGSLAQRTADSLAAKQVGAVVAALAGDTVEIRGAGRTGAAPNATLGRGGTPGPDTLFEIGSVTKVFTSLALARLTLAGSTRLDEPLADLLADTLPPGTAVPSKGGEQITLRHLATHTAGLPRLPAGMLLPALLNPRKPDPYAHCTADFLLTGLGRTRLRARPGRSFRYSNLGSGLLGLALTRRAGLDDGTPGSGYEKLIAREVCEPLGLADTVVTVSEEQAARLCRGHSGRRRPVPAWHLADLAGAGALRSTAADLAVLLRAQLAVATGDDRSDAAGPAAGATTGPTTGDASGGGGRADGKGQADDGDRTDGEGGGQADGRKGAGPLAPAIALTREVRHRVNPFAWMHLGWLGHRLHPRQGGHLQIWHNGGTGGFRSFVAFDPEKRVGVIALGNTGRSVDPEGIRLLRTLQREYATTSG